VKKWHIVAQPVFSKIKNKTFTVEISSPIIWAISAICKKATQRKQSPNGRKFAQSGHPASNLLNAFCGGY
jgi:hypothetical protein